MAADVPAIVLAAGMSRRMGTCKQLLPLGVKPAILHCLETVIASGIREVVVVTGANGDAVAAAVSHLPVKIVRNNSIDEHMAGSVRVGLEALDSEPGGVMICLADQPLVEQETFLRLLMQHVATPEAILIPVFEGRKGHPTLFPARLLKTILQGGTLRDIIADNQHQVSLIQVNDQGVALDMDTPADYGIMRERFNGRQYKS